MHRLVSIPGVDSSENISLVEQPEAPILLLSSAASDIATLSKTLGQKKFSNWKNLIRALCLSAIDHPAQIDHYLSTTASSSKIILIRLLGGRGHWSYGLEQLIIWANAAKDRNLIILSGTKEHEEELHSISNIDNSLVDHMAILFREGGISNIENLLYILENIYNKRQINIDKLNVNRLPDPSPWDWRNDKGAKVGILFYRSLLQSGDIDFPKEVLRKFRDRLICPRAIWVSSLRERKIQNRVIGLLEKEKVELVITATAFASIQFGEDSSSPIWDKLNLPLIQLITSSSTKNAWEKSSIGLKPIDLTLQIALPELDGRITGLPGAFKSVKDENSYLSTKIQHLVPYSEGIDWVINHSKSWIRLRHTEPKDLKLSIVIANYPIRNGRVGNGVGLDTPESVYLILKELEKLGVTMNSKILPKNSQLLVETLLKQRTNDPLSLSKEPLTYISLSSYLDWWDTLSDKVRKPIVERWGEPSEAIDLEKKGFSIHGVRYGNLTLLIQPSRGYDSDNFDDLHCPDLPPPHRYLAQYLWMREFEKINLIINVGKHGSAEWLPGKGVGLSHNCYPQVVHNHIPIIYPFIVNDPGEGTQAKRRGQAIIIDHLTPPLGRAELHGDLLNLENLIDEYFEVIQLGGERLEAIRQLLIRKLNDMNWPGIDKHKGIDNCTDRDIDTYIIKTAGYLCEIKESQIRTGLHIFGQTPSDDRIIEFILCIARSPSINSPGITQVLADLMNFSFDPLSDDEHTSLDTNDRIILSQHNIKSKPIVGDLVCWLEFQALIVIKYIYSKYNSRDTNNFDLSSLNINIKNWLLYQVDSKIVQRIEKRIIPCLLSSSYKEIYSLINAIKGNRVESGPSGAPTRGRLDTLPTGRNFYSLDLRSVPTEAAWLVGRQSAERLLDLFLLEEGEHLKSIAVSVWGTSTMRNGGEDIAQLLALLGVRPVWDGSNRRVIDLEIIPLNQLKRPRVDVTLRISGLFRDAFPHLISIVNRAQNLIANSNEPHEMNPLAKLKSEGNYKGKIYGSAPGAYGAGLQALIDSGSWENRSDLGEAYLSWSKWKYDGTHEPKEDKKGLEETLGTIQAIIHNQDNREHDILDSDDYYQFQGGLSAAVEKISGKQAKLMFGDHSRFQRPRVYPLEKELDKLIRSRLTNPKWIEGMKRHGFKGAFELGASIDYLFAYDATTGKVPDWAYSSINNSWLNSKSTYNFLKSKNPWVLKDIAERLLEAHNRGLWKTAINDDINKLKDTVIEIEGLIETR